jgi:hypothetical protein
MRTCRDGPSQRPHLLHHAALALFVFASPSLLLAHSVTSSLDSDVRSRVEIGGASTSTAFFDADGVDWTLFNVGNHLRATLVEPAGSPTFSFEVKGCIRDIEILSRGGRRIALLAAGTDGIAAVDVSNPMNMSLLTQVSVNHFKDGLTWAEGGGAILLDQEIAGTRSNISSVATDGRTVWIGNEDFGIHRTGLGNLLGANGPQVEGDGTLVIDHEVYTLQYAGEIPWGGPLSLELTGGRIFASMGSLGLGIFDPVTLEQVGGYNLYTDVGVVEDWFIGMDVAAEVSPGFLDAFTGMPDYRQANFEIVEVWHGEVDAPTPWADFDRYGKWYYQARRARVADFGETSIAYVAYGLGGLVAVDVSGYRTATAASYLQGAYLGYAPGVPAHGPDEPTQSDEGPGGGSLYPHYGAGMLKEAGVVDVAVVGSQVYYTDHFAGLVVLDHAEDPALFWHGASAPYDNDDPTLGDGVLGDHWPDYEFVTSYDMDPYDPTDHESLPVWMYESPTLLVSGEIGGHGNSFVLNPVMNVAPDTADVFVCAGAGGYLSLDIKDLSHPVLAERFAILSAYATTDEIGADPGGVLIPISIGHTQGITVSRGTLYLADGPHGVTAWKLLNADGSFAEELHIVANSLQDEYPVEFEGTTYYPLPHAYGVKFDSSHGTLLTLCQGRGMRRIDVTPVETGVGQVGAPLLISPLITDIFEHNTETGSVDGTPKQDHAYDVEVFGDYAFVADGGNGLTVYDLTKDPSDLMSGFVVDNLGGSAQGKAELGRSTGIALWRDPATSKHYALMAAGPRGVGVVDISDPSDLTLVKVFEPIKIEDGQVGHADGRAVDVFAIGGHAYFSYDSFGIVCYTTADLIEPLPAGIDPTDIWKIESGSVLYDYRPEAVVRFRVKDIPGYEESTGGALNMDVTRVAGSLFFHVAYGSGGLAKIDWSDPANPILIELLPTPGEAAAVAEFHGRRYVADSAGGLIIFK